MACYLLFLALIDIVNSWIRAELGSLADHLKSDYWLKMAQFMLRFYDEARGQSSIRSIRRLQLEGGGGLLECMEYLVRSDEGFFANWDEI